MISACADRQLHALRNSVNQKQTFRVWFNPSPFLETSATADAAYHGCAKHNKAGNNTDGALPAANRKSSEGEILLHSDIGLSFDQWRQPFKQPHMVGGAMSKLNGSYNKALNSVVEPSHIDILVTAKIL